MIIDSRRVTGGALFAALPGERVDGHDYAPAAVAAGRRRGARRPAGARGAPAVVVPDVTVALGALAGAVLGRLPGRDRHRDHRVVGQDLDQGPHGQVVERLGPTIAPEDSFNNEIGLPLTVLRADEATRYLVLEMSARGIGHIADLCDIAPPRIGAVLNVGRAHAGEFGSLDAVAQGEGRAAGGAARRRRGGAQRRRPAGARDGRRHGGPRGDVRRARHRGRDVRAGDIRLDDLGRASFRLLMPGGSADVALRLHGAHHVSNALAAAAIAAELGMDTLAIAAALSAATVAEQAADGGARAARRGTGRKRRLQRQP